ncbi:thioredoxin domain-containing protein [Parasphingorhabdus sp.]|uniref:thioredoxin domain-containing protein n=1 Tax=Parasphingorhabdus sp. TaxID=2709688 RepID=UPI0007F42299|nr:protein-disulfide isomerase [Sphingomonadales bacterium EhC05]
MRKSLSLFPISLALALSACGGAADTAETGSSESIAEVAAPDGQTWSTTVSQTEAGGFVMGNPDAPLKLVEYMSITCSHCATFGEEAFDSIRDDYVNSGRVSFEVRNFVRDPVDLSAAILSRCGGGGPYFALTKQALNAQNEFLTTAQAKQADGSLENALRLPPESRFVQLSEDLGLTAFFQQRGIAADQAKACLADVAAAEKLVDDTQKASEEQNITGTPTFLLNGQKMDASNWTMVEAQLKEAGAR